MPSAAPGIPAIAAAGLLPAGLLRELGLQGKKSIGTPGAADRWAVGEFRLPHCGAPFLQGAPDQDFPDLYDVDGPVKAFGVRQAHGAIALRPGNWYLI